VTELQAFTYVVLPLAIMAAAYVAVLRHERRALTPAPAVNSVRENVAHSIPFALKGIVVGAGAAAVVAVALVLLLRGSSVVPIERFLTSITAIVHTPVPAKIIRAPRDEVGVQ
jgi:hypothetical protein